MGIGIKEILIILLVVLIVFGAGKLPRVMGDLGKGLRSFKDGLKGEGDDDGDNGKSLPPSDKPGA
jgi:sec-independent protein translocase protein TatA